MNIMLFISSYELMTQF